MNDILLIVHQENISTCNIQNVHMCDKCMHLLFVYL